MQTKASQQPATAWSIATRLIVLFTASASLLVVMVVAIMYFAIARHLDEEHEHLVSEIVHVLQTSSSPESGIGNLIDDERRIATTDPASYSDPYSIRVLDEHGRVLAQSRHMETIPVSAFTTSPVQSGHRVRPKRWISQRGDSFLLAALVIPARNGTTSVLQVALDVTRDRILMKELRDTAVILVSLALLVATLAGALVVRRSLRPLEQITNEVAGISVERLGWRLPVHARPRELYGLVVAFNTVLDRLDRAFGRMSQFSANLAHELRTPLNNLRGEAEVALLKPRNPDEYEEVLASSLEEYGRLSTMIDGLLFLSRAESHETTLRGVPADLAAEAREVCEFYSAVAEERDISLTVDGEATANVDQDLFRRALGNLVANALRHVDAHGHVTVRLSRTDREATLRVIDDGIGIDKNDLPKVFDRFYRGSNLRGDAGGSGLGLAIVKSIMDLHHGGVEIESERARGTIVTLRFPRHTAR